MTHNPFAVAHQLAPVPAVDGLSDDLARFHAAQAFAAFAVFNREIRNLPANPEPGSRPDLGYLSALGVASLHVARLLSDTPDDTDPFVKSLWELTPGYGANNGEAEEWLTGALDRLGINPADIDPAYEAGDFRSPSRLAEVAG